MKPAGGNGLLRGRQSPLAASSNERSKYSAGPPSPHFTVNPFALLQGYLLAADLVDLPLDDFCSRF
jgi:hypothetical protein